MLKLNLHRFANQAMILATFLIVADVNTTLLLVFDIRAPISPLILVLVLVGLGSLLKTDAGMRLPMKLLLMSLGLYVVLGSLSALIHLDEHHPMLFEENEHMLRIRGYITTMLVVFTYYMFIKRKIKEGKFFRFLLFVGWIFVLTAATIPLSEYFDFHQYYAKATGDDYTRMTGIYKGTSEAGVQAGYALLFVLFFIVSTWYERKVLYILLSFVAIYAAIATFSKAAMLSCLVLLVLFLLAALLPERSLPGAGKAKLSMAVKVYIGVIFALAFILPGYAVSYYNSLTLHQQERIDDAAAIMQGDVSDETTSDRNSVAEEGLQLISEHPVLGNGIASFHRLPRNGLGVHNTYLMILGESGLIPFSLFLTVIVITLWKGYRLFWRHRIFGFLVGGALMILYLQVFLPTHTALLDRRSNMMLALCLAVLSFRNHFLGSYEEVGEEKKVPRKKRVLQPLNWARFP